MTTSPKIILVGHCGPDVAMLTGAVRRHVPGASIERINSASQLDEASGGAVLLVNRVLDGAFPTTEGIEFIRTLMARDASTKAMLVSNFEDAQADAVAAGATPGFGKRDLYAASTGERLRAATGTPST